MPESRDRYRVLVQQDDLDQYLLPVLKANGSEIPTPGAYVAVVEFDDLGEVVAYQMIQRAVFLEGMWARDKDAHFRTIWNIAHDFLRENHGTGVMTFARNDTELGLRIGRVAERMGCEKLPLNVYRRMF